MKRKRKTGRIALLVCCLSLLAVVGGALALRGDVRFRLIHGLARAVSHGRTPEQTDPVCRSLSLESLLALPEAALRYDLMLIDPAHPLPKDFVPALEEYGDSGVRATKETLAAYAALAADALAECGEKLLVTAAYRTEDEQRATIGEAGELAASVGASEHQAGLALDLCVRGYGGYSFLKTAAGRYANANCARYGLTVRYPADKTAITGIAYEPWHFRYVGAPHAEIMEENALSLEEYLVFFEIGAWYGYGDYLLSRQEGPVFSLPENVSSVLLSPDGTGNWFLTVR
ncbi:MAG: M15 family metallopeptidase [Clostridia bacterium]|nr:M15 family metallopeptidase [Clostridia bacterium]